MLKIIRVIINNRVVAPPEFQHLGKLVENERIYRPINKALEVSTNTLSYELLSNSYINNLRDAVARAIEETHYGKKWETFGKEEQRKISQEWRELVLEEGILQDSVNGFWAIVNLIYNFGNDNPLIRVWGRYKGLDSDKKGLLYSLLNERDEQFAGELRKNYVGRYQILTPFGFKDYEIKELEKRVNIKLPDF